MYYETKIENGRMYWRGTPSDTWKECAVETVVRLLQTKTECFNDLVSKHMELEEKYNSLLESISSTIELYRK